MNAERDRSCTPHPTVRRAAPRLRRTRYYASRVGLSRQCTKTGCTRRAVATLTYAYGDQTAVLGPLATYAEPHTYDLCGTHASGLTAPRGWEVVRLALDVEQPLAAADDLLAVADAVRERGRPLAAAAPCPRLEPPQVLESKPRRHLRAVRDG